MVTKKIFLKSTDEVIHLLGKQDENLRNLERKYGVQIFVRQSGSVGDFSVVVRGPSGKVDRVISELEEIRSKVINNGTENVYSGRSLEASPKEVISNYFFTTFHGKHIDSRSDTQKKYIEASLKYDLVVGIGPAGTGKTFLAVACALKALQMGKVARIVITRPVVEAGEKLGFLPGDLYEKINPYLKPLYDSFHYMLGPEKFKYFREEETIEIVPLAYMRGRTIDNSFIILDEAQNTTSEQMKMFLTRIGADSQAMITGDVTQVDLDKKEKSGLIIAEKILSGIDGIKFIHFSENDVVRHELVKKIIKAYEKWGKKINV
ncbi:PhoH family protein [Elusimicrobiota bacterium]